MIMKILIIEDNPDHAIVTKRILRRADRDYQVESVIEGREGIKKIMEEDYNLVLSDYRLPDSNALDVLKEIKSKGKDLPFIVTTSAGSEKIAVELMKQGAYDYVLKDISYQDTLPIVIERAFERYKEKKEKEILE